MPGPRTKLKRMDAWLDAVKWDRDGLVPVIAQEVGSNDVLMFAFMNREALAETVQTDTGGSEVESGRGAEPAGADEQDFRLAQLHLALAAHVAQNNLTTVSFYLSFSEFHSWVVLSAVSYQLSAVSFQS